MIISTNGGSLFRVTSFSGVNERTEGEEFVGIKFTCEPEKKLAFGVGHSGGSYHSFYSLRGRMTLPPTNQWTRLDLSAIFTLTLTFNVGAVQLPLDTIAAAAWLMQATFQSLWDRCLIFSRVALNSQITSISGIMKRINFLKGIEKETIKRR